MNEFLLSVTVVKAESVVNELVLGGLVNLLVRVAGLVIKRLRVRTPAGEEEEFSSPDLTLYADSQ